MAPGAIWFADRAFADGRPSEDVLILSTGRDHERNPFRLDRQRCVAASFRIGAARTHSLTSAAANGRMQPSHDRRREQSARAVEPTGQAYDGRNYAGTVSYTHLRAH